MSFSVETKHFRDTWTDSFKVQMKYMNICPKCSCMTNKKSSLFQSDLQQQPSFQIVSVAEQENLTGIRTYKLLSTIAEYTATSNVLHGLTLM